jgi:16S rRNA (guanine527-N7)-methyltransferase
MQADEPAAAAIVFGERLELARRFHNVLATDGHTWGLIGPREVPRLWDRHLLNCAVLTELVPERARVVDVGSGAGLPGLALAIRRPDLRVDLVESLLRRTQFLDAAVARLGLSDQVRVIHGRAEDANVVTQLGSVGWVTARAVAPLDRLVAWCLPLLAPRGHLLAIKGASAAREIGTHKSAIRRRGADEVRLVRCGIGLLAIPTTVVTVRRRD